MLKCPVCGGNQVGMVANDQYYCWHCYLEFNYAAGRLHLYEIAEDGSLIAVEKGSLLL
jgi:hypothetical protein